MLAATVRVTRDLDLAEEAVQDAYVQALTAWQEGAPRNPGAWLTTVARRNALNALQRQATLQRKLPLLLGEHDPVDEFPDDRLRLVFICCHPALAWEAQVALTLRLVCGVPTPDIAHAFLVREPAMAARITRAKQKIAAARIPFAIPEDLTPRVDVVLTVIHLLYATGHSAHSGENLVRDELTARALDLARMLHALLPREGEVAGLLALLLVHEARRATRTDGQGRFIKLADQDRSRWNAALIEHADALIVETLRRTAPGRFTLQAAIAALHAQAPTYEETDWPQILTLYDELLRVWPSPVVALNRAVALAMVDGPAPALREVEALAGLDRYRYFHSTRADLLHRLGRDAEAVAAYEAALALTGNAAEQAFLEAAISASRPV